MLIAVALLAVVLLVIGLVLLMLVGIAVMYADMNSLTMDDHVTDTQLSPKLFGVRVVDGTDSPKLTDSELPTTPTTRNHMTSEIIYKCNICGGSLNSADGMGIEISGRFAPHHGPTATVQEAKAHMAHIHHVCAEGIAVMYADMNSLTLSHHVADIQPSSKPFGAKAADGADRPKLPENLTDDELQTFVFLVERELDRLHCERFDIASPGGRRHMAESLRSLLLTAGLL